MVFRTSGKTPLFSGGEGNLYEYGADGLVKVYNSHVDLKSKEAKIDLLLKISFPSEVIAPLEKVTDQDCQFIGYRMKKVRGEILQKLYNKKFVKSHDVTTKDVLELLDKLWNTLKVIHGMNVFVGDLNGKNILFDWSTKEVFFIDVDSWSVGNYPCTVAMDLYKDPLLTGTNFNANTDTYAFCVLAWNALTLIHPFGGSTNPDMQIMDRINKRISIIDNHAVTVPKIAKPWVNLSPDMISAFKSVFENDDRQFGDYISDMLSHLAYCKKDRDYYYSKYNKCPICDATAKVIKKAVSVGVEGGFRVISVLLYPEKIKNVFSENIFLDKDGYINDNNTGKRVIYTGNRVLFDNTGNPIVHDIYSNTVKIDALNGNSYTIPIRGNSYPEIDGDSVYIIDRNDTLSSLVVKNGHIGKTDYVKCAKRCFYSVSNGNICVVNIYPKQLVIYINGYYYTAAYDGDVIDSSQNYDSKTKCWLVVLENSNGKQYSMILKNNILKWSSDQNIFKCSLYNICFYNRTVFIPIDDAIRGFNPATGNYKDFSCNVVSYDSKIIRRGNKFVIVNADNVYHFMR